MPIGGQERGQPRQLGLIGAYRVRAAVRFQLKPADVFRDRGLQVVEHIEAACMLPHSHAMCARHHLRRIDPESHPLPLLPCCSWPAHAARLVGARGLLPPPPRTLPSSSATCRAVCTGATSLVTSTAT